MKLFFKKLIGRYLNIVYFEQKTQTIIVNYIVHQQFVREYVYYGTIGPSKPPKQEKSLFKTPEQLQKFKLPNIMNKEDKTTQTHTVAENFDVKVIINDMSVDI